MAFAAGVYIRNNGHFSEFIISGMAESIVSVSEGESRMVVELTTPLSADAAGSFNDPFIKSLSVDGRMVTLSFFPNTDYTLSRSKGDILITAARKKTSDDIQLGYGIEQPLIKSTDRILADKNAEEVLGMMDDAMAEEDLPYALSLAENFLNSGIEGYYRQEGLFRMGMIYFKMGEQSDDNYIFAARIFDDFLKQYPDSFRKKDVLIKTAEAKELAMLYSEAVFSYNNIIKSLRDRDIRKMSYERIAEIYSKSGQYVQAIDAHENVIYNFPETFTIQTAKIGMLHAKRKDFDLAYKTFLTVLDHKEELGLLGAEELYTMGEVLSSRNKFGVAREAFEKVYSLYPSDELADMSMYRSAIMLEKENKGDAVDARLDICRQVYKEKKGGLLCAVMFARRHIEEKMPEEWETALESALNSDDLDIRAEAELVLIKAFFKQNKYEDADKRVENFIRKNFTSDHLPEVYDIRQQITLTKAKDAYSKSNYALAQQLIEGMLEVFPDTKHKREALEILQDIRFGDIRDRFAAGQYKETIDDLTKFLLENDDLINPDKWVAMLEEAKFAYAQELYQQGHLTDAVIAASEYRVSFPEGAHLTEASNIQKDAISITIDDYYEKNEFINIIGLNEQNSDFIQNGGDRIFRDKVKSITAFSLFKMGMKDQSLTMLNQVEDKQNPYYLMTAIMLDQLKTDVSPDVFTDNMMGFLVQELENTRPDYLIELLKKYTNNKAYAAQKMYSISKDVFDDLKRESILFDLTQKLDRDEGTRFDGYEEVYLDTGISYYKRNNFENAATALEKFKLQYSPRDEKRAEGLYYLGKTYRKMQGKDEQAVNALMELLESVPGSVYASAARSELEEIKWRKNLTK
ncbi:Tetratricopeptide TPR_2 repeat protein [Denitrovibrio acetiphilus DSM 12809]|uniref:Tetratricopeptide TPR_2 repeat protein n=2 Tax=Denitrovibrio TaxID=117999 RepID=D4H361_DENA2|nr:Tetratricopeptide TPR_2 repeat protein [Denitrovibrio acetiphilus DSM 12809]